MTEADLLQREPFWIQNLQAVKQGLNKELAWNRYFSNCIVSNVCLPIGFWLYFQFLTVLLFCECHQFNFDSECSVSSLGWLPDLLFSCMCRRVCMCVSWLNINPHHMFQNFNLQKNWRLCIVLLQLKFYVLLANKIQKKTEVLRWQNVNFNIFCRAPQLG